MLEDTRLKHPNQMNIEQKIKHAFLLQRNMNEAARVTETNYQFHIDRSRDLGNHDTATAYHQAVAQTALNMLGNRFAADEIGDNYEAQ